MSNCRLTLINLASLCKNLGFLLLNTSLYTSILSFSSASLKKKSVCFYFWLRKSIAYYTFSSSWSLLGFLETNFLFDSSMSSSNRSLLQKRQEEFVYTYHKQFCVNWCFKVWEMVAPNYHVQSYPSNKSFYQTSFSHLSLVLIALWYIEVSI